MKAKKKTHILPIMLLLLTMAAVAIYAYLYPTWKAARVIANEMARVCFSYRLEIELDKGVLAEEQRNALETMAKLMGIGEDAMYRLDMQGSVQEDKIHVVIFPGGAREPLLEFYLSDGTNVINETMIYEAIRGNLAKEYAFLEYLMPRQEETLYMTLDQLEQIFCLDMSAVRGFDLPIADSSFTAGQYFITLAAMSREKRGHGYRFTLEATKMSLFFDLSLQKGEDTAVTMQLSVQDPEETFSEGAQLLSRMGIQMQDEQIRSLKSFSLTLTSEEGGTIVMPTNFVNQSVIDVISQIRAWVSKIFAPAPNGG